MVGEIKLPGKFDDAAVTGADISPDGKKIALITHKNVFLLENFQQDNFTKATVNRIDLQNNSQKEGICFAGNKRLFITEERTSKEDGKIYFIDLK